MENLIGDKDAVIDKLTKQLQLSKEEAIRWHKVARDFQDENYKLRVQINSMREYFSKLKSVVNEASEELEL